MNELRKKRLCSIAGCTRPHFGRSWCSRHWQRWYKHGDVNAMLRAPDGSGCIVDGYRQIHVNGKQCKEHRVIMERHLRRRLRSSELIHHKDGNKLNNDIRNLEIVTRSHHMEIHKHEFEPKRLQSMISLRGEGNPKAILTAKQVKIIRSTIPFLKYREHLAKRFGTTVANIHTILSGYSWRHLL